MKLEFAIHVSKGFLPSEGSIASRGSQVQGRRRSGSESMDMDADDEEGDAETVQAGAEEGDDGLDVTLWKKVAEPIELKKVWKAVMSRLPGGMITAT